ncbi:APC amino acid permease [Flagelloscypha sp. PMI_526]|nr:APC amino acid permease [Flagelloscypha sp. PMI_526]
MSKDDEKQGSSTDVTVEETLFYDPSKESRWTRLGLTLESFKRAPGTTAGQVVAGSVDDLEKVQKDSPMLQQKMKPRHLNMIAVGGSIGTGLFVGSGAALSTGGPAGVLIGWLIIGVMLVNVTQALGEMCIMYPVSGGFYTLAVRFLDPSFAFAMGWNYWLSWVVTLPLEIVVVTETVNWWDGAQNLTPGGWIAIWWLVIIIICLFGTLGFAEEEFWSSVLKLGVLIMFLFLGVICITGGGPSSGEFGKYVGGARWQDPGAFANGFKGVCSTFVTAAFSYSGTELVGLAASETPNPRKTMPGAVKGTIWRITLIYITTLVIVGLMVPFDHPNLLGASGASASPLVIACELANIAGIPHLINATICISVMSIGLSSVYAASRTLTALAETGYAPRIFAYVDKSSRPLPSVALALAFGGLAYLEFASDGSTVFNWLVALSGLSVLFTWLSICLCHIRFRAAWTAQGHSIEELPFKAFGGVYGSWLGVVLITLVIIGQFYLAIWPIGGGGSPAERAESFFLAFLAVPIVILFTIGGLVWKKAWPRKIMEIDLDSGRKSWLTVEDMRAYRAERAAAPLHVRIFRLLFTN